MSSYTRQTWANGADGHTPINAARLTHIETGIGDVSDEVFDGRLADGMIPELDGSSFADGQVMVYSATLGKFVPSNPTGNSELAYNENITGTVTNVSTSGGLGTSVNVPGCSIVVPVSARPVWISFGLTYIQTGSAAPGSLYLAAKDGSTIVGLSVTALPNSVSGEQYVRTVKAVARLGAVASTKTILLNAQLFTGTGVAAGISILNASTNDNRSYIGAEAK